uniref:Leucine rich repeat containing 71 n=1 Tax=Falco tinnunculus TaxID=100819 RepID=A0A8C4V256_FALTI
MASPPSPESPSGRPPASLRMVSGAGGGVGEEPTEPTLVGVLARIERKYSYFQPCIQVEREPQDPRSTRAVFLRGWKMEEPMLGVLSQCLPTLAGLGGTSGGGCLLRRTLSLEGNPLPTPAFHTLMGSDSPLVHLSLRNNRIGDEDARLIGKGLSMLSPSGRSLASLILSFNRISDLGAAYIARGLRLNRSLLFLSLENNDIGDVGATRLAEVLAPFALTHDEVVERRRLLLAEALGQSCTVRHSPPLPRGPPCVQAPDPAELPHPLLAEAREHQGSVILPGNRALLNLNLAYNHVTERGLGAFLAALEEQQREKKPKVPGQEGLLCLSLEVSRVGRGAGTAVGLASPMGMWWGHRRGAGITRGHTVRHRHGAGFTTGLASPTGTWWGHHRGAGIASWHVVGHHHGAGFTTGLASPWGWHMPTGTWWGIAMGLVSPTSTWWGIAMGLALPWGWHRHGAHGGASP